jgi:hypothetical protein
LHSCSVDRPDGWLMHASQAHQQQPYYSIRNEWLITKHKIEVVIRPTACGTPELEILA